MLTKLGQGSFGCVLSHPLPCEGESRTRTRSETGSVGKLISRKNSFDTDWKFAQRLREIDPEQTCMVYPRSECVVKRSKAVMNAFYNQHCDSVTRDMPYHDSTLYQLVIPRAGRDLYKILHDQGTDRTDMDRVATSLKGLLLSCKTLIQGLVRLSRHGVCHHDIKEDNIVVQNGTFKFIDFGLSKPFDLLYKTPDRLRSIRGSYPPEYQLISKVFYHETVREGALLKLLNDPYLKLHFSQDEILGAREEAHTALLQLKPETWDREMARFANRVDIYSTGRVIAKLIHHYHPEVEHDLKSPVRTWIRSMMHPNFKKRSTPAAAMIQLNSLLRASAPN